MVAIKFTITIFTLFTKTAVTRLAQAEQLEADLHAVVTTGRPPHHTEAVFTQQLRSSSLGEGGSHIAIAEGADQRQAKLNRSHEREQTQLI